MIPTKTDLFPKIKETIEIARVQGIGEERKMILEPLIDFIQNKVNQNQAIRINFICTHNSRRSHISQVWAQTLAYYFNIKTVFCYSGGTEATALFPMVAETLGNQGFAIQKLSETNNPVYAIKFAENEHPIIGFSKKMDHEFNPKSEFAAIMTCDSANEACPYVPGAEQRVPITFEDPKAFDNTPQQAQKYLERSIQIATELYYVFSQIESKE
ncbi:arsenate-mycothiol transferase ArsC [Aestuariivivens sediminicola]|uniref:arsenate-mycothiol transferase ArsC n=1 Tax=Aestuariivivens sediminicola TaxID=2913560 RepID=UPI001F567602|nr:protein-tyrosine-phosphatase [Aestuariivivens sediminicola]